MKPLLAISCALLVGFLIWGTAGGGIEDYILREFKRGFDESGEEKVAMAEAKQRQMKEARLANDKTKKPYLLSGDEIQQLIPNIGGCFVTDRILVDGERVGYMYREEPDFAEDSGWRFLAGDETDEYMDDQWNTGIVQVNTVCNYDRDIIVLLDSSPGSAFTRNPANGDLEPVKATESQ